MKTTLLATVSALVLSAGAASAATAITTSSITLRAGPGAQYQVVARVPARAAVEVDGCSAGWCDVSFGGAEGYASAAALQFAGAPGPVAGAYYDYGYGYDDVPGYLYATPGFYGRGVHHRDHRNAGNWQHGNSGSWQHGGHPPVIAQPRSPQPGFAGPPANWRGNPGIGQGAPTVSAPAGLRNGGSGFGRPLASPGGAMHAPSAPAIHAPAAAPGGHQGFGPPLAK